jgi:methionine synthase I (cobalamin-dependent)
LVDGEAVYRVTPEGFAVAEKEMLAAGVRVLGGCCGTAPAFIEAVAQAVK